MISCLNYFEFQVKSLEAGAPKSDKAKPFETETPTGDNGIKKHLLQACKALTAENATQFQARGTLNRGRWIISQNFKLIACKVHKAGSTNLGRVLYTLDHFKESKDTNKLDQHTARTKAAFDKKYKNEASFEAEFNKSWTKFMFVRPPLQRLLSAYRARLPRGWFIKNKNHTFQHFLEVVAAKSDKGANPHLVSFSRACNPCKLKLDFIGSTNNYNEDMRKILKHVGADEYIKLPERNQTGYSNRKSSEALQEYLKYIPKSLLQKIYQKYYWDYFLFGFTKPDF